MNLRILLLIAAMFAIVSCSVDPAKPPVRVERTPQPQVGPPTKGGHDHADHGDNAPRIELAAAKKDFDDKSAVFIDTHSPDQFAQRHIPGAINVPANDMEPHLNKIPKGKKIIAYCS